ncbi:terminase large subunit [Sphingomonas hankookensis]|uniref:terminase large subunit n=1 Tax=Sphingomonas hankookensis TaxID=563996 RepID=UPI000B09ED23|nr:terminase TerL endonuclease subunit [Sphingomonas hankookensis]
MRLRPVVRQAIKSGPVPKLRDWRSLPTSKLTRAERNMKFCERYLRVPEGDLVGQPIKLADFQEAFFYAVYDNKVMTKRAILSMARKNSKTGTIAMIVLVHLVGPEAKQNSRIASGARSRKQAAEVYNYASKMAALSPDLRNRVRPVPSAKKLVGLAMNVEYDAVSAEGSTAHGGSYIVVVLDEVGQVKGPQDDFVDAMVTSQGAYSDGLLFVISTQAPTDADMMSILLDDAERAGDMATICHLYAAAPDCDLLDPKALAAANPALGLFRSKSDAEEQLQQAARMPSKEATARVLILNQRQNMVAALVAASVWKRGNVEPAPWDHSAIYGGLDLSATTDLTSLVLTQRQGGVLMVRAWFWMPEANIAIASKRDRTPYDVWVKKGLIRTTPGNVIDYAFVARDVGEICGDLPVPVKRLAFDRWRMDRLKVELAKIGVELPLEPFGQGFVSMSPAIDAIEEDLLKGQVHHGGNPPLAMCAANAVAVPDPAGNRKLDKSKSTGRIDGMVALTMARGVEAMFTDPEVNVDDWIASMRG